MICLFLATSAPAFAGAIDYDLFKCLPGAALGVFVLPPFLFGLTGDKTCIALPAPSWQSGVLPDLIVAVREIAFVAMQGDAAVVFNRPTPRRVVSPQMAEA